LFWTKKIIIVINKQTPSETPYLEGALSEDDLLPQNEESGLVYDTKSQYRVSRYGSLPASRQGLEGQIGRKYMSIILGPIRPDLLRRLWRCFSERLPQSALPKLL
jgi:hypothetical protein